MVDAGWRSLLAHYLDTSVIVATLSKQAATDRAQTWMAAPDQVEPHISNWTASELSSATSIKLLTGQIALEQRAAVLAMFNRLTSETFTVPPISAAHFRTAAKFADQHSLKLRTGDVLHLAAATEHGAVARTFDQRLARPGPILGLPTNLLT